MTPSTDPTARADALAVLGLPETATGAEIAHAYRRLVRATHPDATGRTDPGAAQEFAAINHAYQLLSHTADHPADHPVEEPAEAPVEASPPPGLDDESAPSPEAWPPQAWFPQACRLPPMGVPGFRPRPPIVAGPTVVTPLPEQHQRHRRRPR